jgi:hypothetical protein
MIAVAVALTFTLFISVALMIHFKNLSYLVERFLGINFWQVFPIARVLTSSTITCPITPSYAYGSPDNLWAKTPYLTDESWFATKWRRLLIHNSSLEEVNQDLKGQQVSHILYCPRLFTYAAKMGVSGTGGSDLISQNLSDFEEARKLGPEYQFLRNWSTFTLYRSKYLETIYSDDNGCEVCELSDYVIRNCSTDLRNVHTHTKSTCQAIF